jgi:hypothetical protein
MHKGNENSSGVFKIMRGDIKIPAQYYKSGG